jgi:hypothetical protein
VIDALLERLAAEPDYGLRVAYASALGHLGAAEGTRLILATLHDGREEVTRLELALALARILGDEHHFIRLLRQLRADPGTAVAQELTTFKKRLATIAPEDENLATLLDECVNAFAHNDLAQGVALLSQLLRHLPGEVNGDARTTILEECARRLEQYGPSRRGYVLLALHALGVEWNSNPMP